MPWIEANGASLRYELSGLGNESGKETLVLVHEAGGCLESYEDASPGLEKEFRVLRYVFSATSRNCSWIRCCPFSRASEPTAALLTSLPIKASVNRFP